MKLALSSLYRCGSEILDNLQIQNLISHWGRIWKWISHCKVHFYQMQLLAAHEQSNQFSPANWDCRKITAGWVDLGALVEEEAPFEMHLSRRPRSGKSSGSGTGSGKCWKFQGSVSRLVWLDQRSFKCHEVRDCGFWTKLSPDPDTL